MLRELLSDADRMVHRRAFAEEEIDLLLGDDQAAAMAHFASPGSPVIVPISGYVSYGRLAADKENTTIDQSGFDFHSHQTRKILNNSGTARFPLFSFGYCKSHCIVSWKCRRRLYKGSEPRFAG